MSVREVRSQCPYCGVGCGVVLQVENGKITRVQGDKAHPANAGRLCTKGNSCHIPVSAPGRAEQAILRGPEGESTLPMAEAIARTAAGLRAIIERDGPDAVSLYVSGQMSLEAQYLANKLAKGFIGTRHIESNSRLCMASAGAGYKLSLGSDGPPGSYDDFAQSNLFFVIGANMADCHPILFLRMMERVKAGAKLIVVDPRRNATAEKADLYLRIRPGTDLALLNGLLYLLHQAGHTDPAFIAAHTEGWAAMPDFLAAYTPAKVSAITDIPEADLIRAAQMIGAAGDWMSLWTMGLNQSTHGTWNTNAICNLHLATGAICRPGAGPFSLTGQPNAMGGREMGYMGPGLPGQRGADRPEDRALVEEIWGLPPGRLRAESGAGTIAMFDEMAAGRLKACWIICTNPVASVANRGAVIAGLEAAELVICQDAYRDTETTRHADLLLPGALWAEADGVMVSSERNMTLCPKAVEPPGEALPDWQIIAEVARAMGYGAAFSYASAAEVFDEIRRFYNPKTGYDIRGASHARLQGGPVQWPVAPEGPARNPIRYLGPEGIAFATPSGRAVFHPRPHLDPAEMPDAEFPMVLNTGRQQHQWHTMTKTGRVPTLNKLNPGPFVEIHPEDAEALGIGPRDRVEIRSRRGRAVLPAEVTDRVRPGNCFAPFHWSDMFGEDLAVNALTSDAVDPVSRQPEFKIAAVALQRVSGPAEAARAAVQATGAPEAPVEAFVRLLEIPGGFAPSFSQTEMAWLAGFANALRSPETGPAGVPYVPEDAPFRPETRAYVSGLLAGLYARVPLPAAVPAPGRGTVLVLWASQTGTAEAVAQAAGARLEAEGWAVRLLAMADATPGDLAQAGRALFVASTFGDGDAPDNATAFWAALSGDTPALSGLRYAVLAFGDSSYDQFCGFGRRLEARLSELGAVALVPRADCEPDHEETSGAWLEAVVAALGGGAAAPVSAPPVAAGIGRKTPLTTRLQRNQLLSLPGAGKEVRQFGFDIAGTELRYEAGDALGIWPENCPDLVAEILARLELPPEAPVTLAGQGTLPLQEAMTRHLDISRVSKELLRALAERDPGAVFAPLLDPARGAELERWLWGRQIADVLHAAPQRMAAQDWAGLLRPLQPRLYSISSSPRAQEGEVQLTVSVVRYGCEGRARKGVASGFLADRAGAGTPRIFAQASAHFHPPQEGARDVIMIGPGTGIAPFMGFLHDRAATGARGRNWLFFGEQRAATDFYYRDQIEAWQADGHLTRLDLAFSRDQAQKIYVQHRMEEQGAALWGWLEGGAHLYVCGDALRMAKDVDAALKRIAARHGGLSEAAAAEYVARMQKEKRYLRDVY